MNRSLIYPVGISESCRYAEHFLLSSGARLTDHPSPDVTHLLLDIPTFRSDGTIKNGSSLKELLRMLPKDIIVIGGKLEADYLQGYRKFDLLKDPLFLAKNAAITAQCAICLAQSSLSVTLQDATALILGWGRIGKCLAKYLSDLGCCVSIAARKESDRALAETLGYRAVEFSRLEKEIPRHRLLLNTVPEGIQLAQTFDNCVKIDLASLPGLQGQEIIDGRGLPGKYAPESAGNLIAETICRLNKEVAK